MKLISLKIMKVELPVGTALGRNYSDRCIEKVVIIRRHEAHNTRTRGSAHPKMCQFSDNESTAPRRRGREGSPNFCVGCGSPWSHTMSSWLTGLAYTHKRCARVLPFQNVTRRNSDIPGLQRGPISVLAHPPRRSVAATATVLR